MAVLIDVSDVAICFYCDEPAEYVCDHPGCRRFMCVECLPVNADPDTPAEFCEDHIDGPDLARKENPLDTPRSSA